jgi:mono/diheme cytochrome c family protein
MKHLRKYFSCTLFFAVAFCMVLPVVGQTSEDGSKKLFAKNCASCHGKDGKAKTPIAHKLHVKDLTQSKTTDLEMVKQVTEGSFDEMGDQKMPPFKDKLSPEEILSLVAFVKTLRQ